MRGKKCILESLGTSRGYFALCFTIRCKCSFLVSPVQGMLLSLSQTTQQQLMISSEPSGKENWDRSCWTDPRLQSERADSAVFDFPHPPQGNSVYNSLLGTVNKRFYCDVKYVFGTQKDCGGINVGFINKDSDNKLFFTCFTGVHLENWNSLMLLSVSGSFFFFSLFLRHK